MNCLTYCREAEGTGAVNPKSAAPAGLIRRIRKAAGWIAPSVGLVLLPKCPICLATYLALATGVGVSLTTASYLRTAFELLCLGSLGYLAARRLPSLIAWLRETGSARKSGRREAHLLN
jgi:hypothetical protein